MDDLQDLNARARSLDLQQEEGAALDVYRRLIEEAEAPGAAQLARAGDLEVRLGDPAVGALHLARAAELYTDAGLLNLALALCHRLLRLDPPPTDEFLRLGELSATQGYSRDARFGYLEFADRREREGDVEGARSALSDYLRVFPADAAVQRRLAELSGTAPPRAMAPAREPEPESLAAPVEESAEPSVESLVEPTVEEIADPGSDLGILPTILDAGPPEPSFDEAAVAPLEGLESNRADGDWDETPAPPQPDRDALPLLGYGPEFESPAGEEAEEELVEEIVAAEEDGDELELRRKVAAPPEAAEPELPELESPESEHPEPEDAALPLLGARPAQEYVDLGALILSDEVDLPTRVRVQAEQPTGDDARDLEEILALFREKVAQKIDPKDAASHYDLGLAFKEMGLYGDAIAQLQAALRAGASPLATLEVLGECFIESGDPELAARILDRATQLQSAREEDLVGVRHWLARAREALDFDNPTGAA
jgi:tetratricopeptide (TPR) repeat protein